MRLQLNDTLASLAGLLQEIGVLLVRGLAQWQVLPQIRSQEGVGLGNGRVGGLGKVTQSCGRTTRHGVTILDTGHLEQLLGDWGRYDTGTTGSRNQTDQDGTALAKDLWGNIRDMWLKRETFILGNLWDFVWNQTR